MKKLIFVFIFGFLLGSTSIYFYMYNDDLEYNGTKNEASVKAMKAVIVDKGDVEYIVYVGLPSNLSEEKVNEIRERLKVDKPKAEILEWDTFQKSLKSDLKSFVIHNSYPSVNVEEGIVKLINNGFSQYGIGLTWAGGIAFTYNDFQHAKKTFEIFQKSKDGYINYQNTLGYDPTEPRNHMRLLQ